MTAHRSSEVPGLTTGDDPRRNPVEDGAWRRPLPRLPAFLVIGSAVLAALSIGVPNIAPGVDVLAAPDSPARRFFGLGYEMNLPTFFSVLVTVSAAFCHVLVGRLTGGPLGRAFYVTGAVLLVMAFDDFAALHERLDGLGEAIIRTDEYGYVWVIPGLFLGLGVLLAFWRLARDLRGPARRDVLLGIAVFLAAALGLESVNGLLDRPGTDGPPLQIVTHLEEFAENLGIILLLRGSLATLEASRWRSGLGLRTAAGALSPRRRASIQ